MGAGGIAHEFEAGLVRLGQFACDVQAEAGSLGVAGEEGLEHLRALLGRNSGPVVGDVYRHAVAADVEGGNNMLYLPLDKLVEAGKQVTTARAVTSPTDLDELASRIANKVLEEAAAASSARRREGR